MSGFEPSLTFFCAVFSLFLLFFFGVGEWVNGCLRNVLFTAAVGLEMSGFEPSLPCLIFFALCFPFVFFWWVGGVNYCCCSYSSTIFHSTL